MCLIFAVSFRNSDTDKAVSLNKKLSIMMTLKIKTVGATDKEFREVTSREIAETFVYNVYGCHNVEDKDVAFIESKKDFFEENATALYHSGTFLSLGLGMSYDQEDEMMDECDAFEIDNEYKELKDAIMTAELDKVTYIELGEKGQVLQINSELTERGNERKVYAMIWDNKESIKEAKKDDYNAMGIINATHVIYDRDISCDAKDYLLKIRENKERIANCAIDFLKNN